MPWHRSAWLIVVLVASLTDKLLSCTRNRANAATLILSDCRSKIVTFRDFASYIFIVLLDRNKCEFATDQELALRVHSPGGSSYVFCVK